MTTLMTIYYISWLTGCGLVGWNAQKLWLAILALIFISVGWNARLYEVEHSPAKPNSTVETK